MLSFDTRLKFFNYLVIRNQLHTNYIRSQYDNQVLPNCSLCEIDRETVKHLFWDCMVTRRFMQEYDEKMIGLNEDYRTEWTLRDFLFSNKYRTALRPYNIASLYIKKYIWKVKCQGRRPITDEFIGLLRVQIKDLRKAYANNVFFHQLPVIL